MCLEIMPHDVFHSNGQMILYLKRLVNTQSCGLFSKNYAKPIMDFMSPKNITEYELIN